MYLQKSNTTVFWMNLGLETEKKHKFCLKNRDLFVVYMLSFCELNWSFLAEVQKVELVLVQLFF